MWQITTSDPGSGDAKFLSLKHSAREWGPGRHVCVGFSLKALCHQTGAGGEGQPRLWHSSTIKLQSFWKIPNKYLKLIIPKKVWYFKRMSWTSIDLNAVSRYLMTALSKPLSVWMLSHGFWLPGRGLCYLRCRGRLLQASSPYIRLRPYFLQPSPAQARLGALSRRLEFVIISIISVFTAAV